MAQPPQLAKAYKPRRSTRPILEQLPAVTTTELRISSLYRGKTAIIKPLKIPNIASVTVSVTHVEFHFQSLHRGQKGRTETFRLRPWKTGIGIRYAFICNACGWPAPGSEDTELGVLMELEVGHGETEVHAGVQA